jgi:hypothetical protein
MDMNEQVSVIIIANARRSSDGLVWAMRQFQEDTRDTTRMRGKERTIMANAELKPGFLIVVGLVLRGPPTQE